MNFEAIKAIYIFEMTRTFRTLLQSLVSPVISTSLYFIVFGTAIGSRMEDISDVPYGAFIVPGLIMLTVLTQSISNAAFGIYFPKFIGTINEILSAPVSAFEIVIGYVGSIVGYEGLNMLVEAAEKLQQRDILNFTILIIGDVNEIFISCTLSSLSY